MISKMRSIIHDDDDQQIQLEDGVEYVFKKTYYKYGQKHDYCLVLTHSRNAKRQKCDEKTCACAG